MRYRIIRHYQDHDRRRVVREDCSEEEARQHCTDRATASKTNDDPNREPGNWFDAYEPKP